MFLFLHCRSLHYDIGTADISALFSCFGTISKVDMSFDTSTQRSKGYCFVEFADPACAAAAIAMDGFELAGRKVGTLFCAISNSKIVIPGVVLFVLLDVTVISVHLSCFPLSF